MTLLVILLAARPHAGALSGAATAPASGARSDLDGAGGPPRATAEWTYVQSPDGIAQGASGRAPAAALPKADNVVAVLPATDLAWHRIALPKAPPARLRQALAGVLEERLIDEPDDTHLALAQSARAGEPTWVAATHRRWLADQLAALEAVGVVVDRVVPVYAPGERAEGHFFTGNRADDGPAESNLWLSWADAEQAFCLGTAGGLAHTLIGSERAAATHWSATPAAAAGAERWLGQPVAVRSDAEQWLAAARSPWNLRQFDLAARARGLRALRTLGRQVIGPDWRPVRWGLVALLLLQLAGVNLWAWHLNRGIVERRAAIEAVLRGAHPQVRAVLDAPLQMQRETDVLRAVAGRAGDDDLETLLGMTAAAWPEGRAPVERLRFEPGRLVLSAAGWDPAQTQQLRSRLQAVGGQLQASETEFTIARAIAKASP